VRACDDDEVEEEGGATGSGDTGDVRFPAAAGACPIQPSSPLPLVLQLPCPACGYDSNTFEAFMDVCLEVGSGIKTVEQALHR